MMINNRSFRAAAILSAAQLLVLFTLGVTARAQNAPPAENPPPGNANPPATGQAPSGGGELQQITVTGYLIPRVGEGPQPVETLNQDFITKQAYQTVNEVLNQYPGGLSGQNTQTFTGNSNSPASSAYSLKELPVGSTLVLVDGFRFPDYAISINAGTIPFVDLNSIPLAAIDRIEILKDGGSATYGDDAIAGVVNVITKEDYQGADIINFFGESQRGDDAIYHLQMTGGFTEKLGPHGLGSAGEPAGAGKAPVPEVGAAFTPTISVVATFDFYNSTPIDSRDRAFSNDSMFSRLSPNYIDQQIAFFPGNGSYIGVNSGTIWILKPGTTGTNITPNDFVKNGTPNSVRIPTGIFESQLAGREKRYGGTVNVDYKPFEWLKIYDHFIIQRNEETTTTPNQGFSSGDTYGQGGPELVIPARNPFNPFHEDLNPLVGQSLGEFGPWYTDVIGRTFRNVAGVTIQLPWNNWFIDAAANYGESDVSQRVFGSIKTRELQEALNGQLPQLPGVFFNPFNDESVAHSPNAIFYPFLRTTQFQDNRTDLVQYRLLAGGTIWALPSGDLTAAGGLEYRGQSYIQSNDVNSRNFNITSADFAGHLFSARRWVQSIYGELSIPIFGDRWSWPGLRSLQVILDERLDNYSVFGSSAKPKIAVLYKPFDDLTFRATYSEGFIVPSLGQLFSAQSQFQQTVFDPVKGVNANILLTTGGNPKLQPENSYGYYLEAVWTPGSNKEDSWWHWAKGFTAYFDWYQVELRQLIAVPSATTVLAANLPGSVIRAPNGTLTEIFANQTNLGTLLTDGIQFGASYVTPEFNWGKLEFDANGAYVYNYSLNQLEVEANGFAHFLVTDLTDTAGFTPQGPGPDLKIVASIFYSKHVFGNDLFRTGFTLNYENSELDALNDGHGTIPAFSAGLTPPGYIHLVGSWTTVDWQISYEFGPPVEVTPETPKPGYNKEGKQIVGEKAIAPAPEGHGWTWRRLLDNTTFTFGIKNLGDNPPPLAIDGNSGFQGYDTLAANPIRRFFYGQIEKKF